MSKFYKTTYTVNSITLTGVIDTEPKIIVSSKNTRIAYFGIHFNSLENIEKKDKKNCPQAIFVWAYSEECISILENAKRSDRVYIVGKLKKFKNKGKYDFCIVAYHIELQQYLNQANVKIPVDSMLEVEVVDEDEIID